ncbi:hypothetical protein OAI54_05280, partial [Pseudomonadales bacterium]|nr:hypothetical protein [Pseudomonadales bacterium]
GIKKVINLLPGAMQRRTDLNKPRTQNMNRQGFAATTLDDDIKCLLLVIVLAMVKRRRNHPVFGTQLRNQL